VKSQQLEKYIQGALYKMISVFISLYDSFHDCRHMTNHSV